MYVTGGDESWGICIVFVYGVNFTQIELTSKIFFVAFKESRNLILSQLLFYTEMILIIFLFSQIFGKDCLENKGME